MSSLRPIKPLKFPDLKAASFDDEKPSLQWVAPTKLLVDATYQRDLSERSMRLVRRMFEHFAWNRMKPPIVVREGADAFHIIDGQHTAIVAASLGIVEIPVFIVTADAIDERARAFVGHNSDRVKVSSFDIYRALLASGDPDATDVSNVCTRAGVRLRMLSPQSAVAEGDTAAIGIIRRLVRSRGVISARKVLQTLVKARLAPISAAEISAAETIVCLHRKGVDLDLLAQLIRNDPDGTEHSRFKARASRMPVYQVLAKRWMDKLDAVSK